LEIFPIPFGETENASEASLTFKVQAAGLCFCKPEVCGDSSTYVVEFFGENVTF
jgi:hypothetical protein